LRIRRRRAAIIYARNILARTHSTSITYFSRAHARARARAPVRAKTTCEHYRNRHALESSNRCKEVTVADCMNRNLSCAACGCHLTFSIGEKPARCMPPLTERLPLARGRCFIRGHPILEYRLNRGNAAEVRRRRKMEISRRTPGKPKTALADQKSGPLACPKSTHLDVAVHYPRRGEGGPAAERARNRVLVESQLSVALHVGLHRNRVAEGVLAAEGAGYPWKHGRPAGAECRLRTWPGSRARGGACPRSSWEQHMTRGAWSARWQWHTRHARRRALARPWAHPHARWRRMLRRCP